MDRIQAHLPNEAYDPAAEPETAHRIAQAQQSLQAIEDTRTQAAALLAARDQTAGGQQ